MRRASWVSTLTGRGAQPH
ncbi:hypothetical protein HID58_083873 [Brassica napus]|uniref:Uncharacterized protein n=1 Tax=Brassica napus TaxID=3708 RepID=A0ABQ7YER9_BRANA|nr:hypothetical protein HID58_083873 [Brassica napus]